jgi:hypothetical protein
MDNFKIVELMIQYFGKTGALIVLLGIIGYGVTKYITIRRQANLINRIEEYLKVLAQKYSDTITFEQAEIVVRDTYYSSGYSIIQQLYEIVERNNIEKDWNSVKGKVKDLVDIRCSEDLTKLAKFVHEERTLSEIVGSDNREYLLEGILSILEKHSGDGAKRQILSFVRNSFKKFYNADMQKIDRRRSGVED